MLAICCYGLLLMMSSSQYTAVAKHPPRTTVTVGSYGLHLTLILATSQLLFHEQAVSHGTTTTAEKR
jgi:hypothetical protein